MNSAARILRGAAAVWVLLTVAFAHAQTAPVHPAYPTILPPEEQIVRSLQQEPQVLSARAGMRVEQANRDGLVAGSYEWSVRATSQQRREIAGPRYHENGIALERPLRWSGKAGKDAELGDKGVQVAQARYADAWHEAGRELMRRWFDWLREARAVARLEESVALLDRQRDVVARRVRAGDAPRMEIGIAQAERDRAQSAALQARQRRDLAEAALRNRYPLLALQLPQVLPPPPPLADDPQQWQHRMLADNHEIELAQEEAQRSRLEAERAAMNRTPDPTVGVHYMEERDRQERILGVSISIPIAGSARSAQADASASRASMAQEHVRDVQLRVSGQALQVALRAQSARAVWQQLDAIARQSDQTAELTARAYSLGELPLNDTLLARRSALDAANAAEQAKIDALEAQARLLLDAHAIWVSDAH